MEKYLTPQEWQSFQALEGTLGSLQYAKEQARYIPDSAIAMPLMASLAEHMSIIGRELEKLKAIARTNSQK